MRELLGLPSGLMRASARLLLLALSVTTLGPVLHGVHDTDCEPVVIVHNESEHRFSAASPNVDSSAGGDHCVACHFLRTSRGPGSWEPTGLHALSPSDLLAHSDGSLVVALTATPQPARAPPIA